MVRSLVATEHVVTALGARRQVRVSGIFGDDHYKRMTCVTICVARVSTIAGQSAMSAEYRPYFVALNGDVSI